MEELKVLLDYFVVPLFIWVWYTDRKVAVLQTKIEDFEKLDKKLDILFSKIDDLKDEIHKKSEDFLSHNQCNRNCQS